MTRSQGPGRAKKMAGGGRHAEEPYGEHVFPCITLDRNTSTRMDGSVYTRCISGARSTLNPRGRLEGGRKESLIFLLEYPFGHRRASVPPVIAARMGCLRLL